MHFSSLIRTFAAMKVLVIHAAKLKERGENIDKMLKSMGLDYEFIREGDADQLTDEMLDKPWA